MYRTIEILSRGLEFLLLVYGAIAFLAAMLIASAMGWWWMVPFIAAIALWTKRLADLEAED